MNDEKIIEAIKNRDESAINYIITKYSRLLWSITSAVLTNIATVQDVEECVADIFIYLWQHPDKYDSQRGKLKVWLSIMARTRAIDKYRKLIRQKENPLEDGLSIPGLAVIDDILESEQRKQLLLAIRKLGEKEQDLLLRRYYYEQKPKEIALALNVPRKQVENSLYRTKLKLRELLINEKGGF